MVFRKKNTPEHPLRVTPRPKKGGGDRQQQGRSKSRDDSVVSEDEKTEEPGSQKRVARLVDFHHPEEDDDEEINEERGHDKPEHVKENGESDSSIGDNEDDDDEDADAVDDVASKDGNIDDGTSDDDDGGGKLPACEADSASRSEASMKKQLKQLEQTNSLLKRQVKTITSAGTANMVELAAVRKMAKEDLFKKVKFVTTGKLEENAMKYLAVKFHVKEEDRSQWQVTYACQVREALNNKRNNVAQGLKAEVKGKFSV